MNSLHRAAARASGHRTAILSSARYSTGEKGSGAGHGGGSGGTIRDAGGSFGKRQAAQEDQYFRQKQTEQLAMMKEHLAEEISSHEKLIKQHQEAIEKSKDKIQQLEKSAKH